MRPVFKDRVNSFYLINKPNYTLISVALCKFLYGFYTSAIGSMLVPIGELFKINLKTQSVIFPFNYFGQIVIIFFVGYFADMFGKKIVQLSALVLLGLSALLFNYIRSFSMFMVLFLFMGLFGISINTIADATVSDTFKHKKGYYLNIAHVFFGLGALTSPIVFNFVFSMTSDFRSVYFILFIIALVVVFLIAMAKYPSVEDERIKPSVVSGFLRNRNFMILCLYSLLTSGAMHSISGWIPTLFQKNLGISASVSNYSLSFFWLSIVIARTATAFLSKKYQERQLLKILNIIIFVVLAVSFFFDNYWVLLADYMLTGLLMGGTFPLMVAYSAEIFPKYSTSRLAVIFSFSAIGMFSIPALVGIIADIFPIYKILPFTSLPFLVYFFVFGRDAKKHTGYKEPLKR